MRTLEQLIDLDDPCLPRLHASATAGKHLSRFLDPSAQRGAILTWLQVSTRSALGSVAYETGGILVDDGWLRVLGSGHVLFARNVRDWNQGRASGYLLVADDAIGGFFALNTGSLGDDIGIIYYWAPDTLAWESLNMGYGDFLDWTFTDGMAQFYEGLRWQGWRADVATLGPDQCFNFYPFLWTKQGSVQDSTRGIVPIGERWLFNIGLAEQLRGG